MFSTARSTATNSSSPRTPQDTQRKYAESRAARAPVVTSLPFTTTSQLNPDYHSDDRRNFDWTSAYHDSSGQYAAIPDDRTRTPRHFVDSDRGVQNRKPMPDFPIFARLPNEQFIYDQSSSDFYSSLDYDDFSGTTITPSSYSLVPSDELSFSTPESDQSSDRSEDYTPPSTPRDSRSQMPMPPMSSQHMSSYPTLFRDLPDVGYSAPHLIMPEADITRSSRSGSDGNIDPRRELAHDPSRAGSTASVFPAADHPDNESVMSTESEDTVHRLARINARYNAAASALYGGLQHSSPPSIIPAVQRISTPATTPTETSSFSIFTDGPLSSSPTQLLYPDDLSRSNIYRDNALPVRRSSSNSANLSMPIYFPSSYVSSTTSTSMRSSRNQDHFLPPRKEWDSYIVPPTPGNSPQSPHALPTDYYRPPSHAPPERTQGRPLPVPPSIVRRPSTRDGAPVTLEASGAQYSREMPNAGPISAQDGRPRRTGEADQPATRRDQTSTRPSQPPSTSPSQQPTSSTRPYPDENQKDRPRSSKQSSSSKDRHRSGGSGDANRAPELISEESPTHGPRYIVPADSRKSTSRPDPISTTRYTTDDVSSSWHGRSSRDNGDYSDRRESRSDKPDRGYDSSRDDKSKSSRHAQDREQYTSRQERSSRSSATATNEKPQDNGRRRKDSLTQRAVPPSIPMSDIVISPRLVPIVRAAPRPDELTRSYSRGGQPTAAIPQEVQVVYQRSVRKHSDDDRSGGGNGRSNGRDGPATASSRPSTEPHRRFSDSDAPQAPPPFLPSGASSRAPPQPGPMRTRANSISRTVRWNDNLVCPSPSAALPKKDGWFNRRGDQLWTNDGLYMPCPAGREYPPDLDDYPEYGEGWMNDKGVRIDMGHRLIPKAPLRPALKQTK